MLFGKYINKYYLKYAFFFLVGILALVAVDWVQLYLPEYLGDIVNYMSDGGVTAAEGTEIRKIVVWIILIAAGMLIGRITFRLTIFYASKKVEAGLRMQMFEKATHLSQDYFRQNKIGTITAWFTNDIETIEEFFSWGTVMLVDATFLSVLAIYKMVALDWALTLIAAIPAILIVIWGLLVEKFMEKIWTDRQKAFDQLYDFSQENFTGIRVIKAFVKENQQIHAFAKVARKNQDINVNFVRISVLFALLIQILIQMIFAILLGFGGWFVYATVKGDPVVLFGRTIELSAGNLVTFLGYFETLVWPMIALGQVISMHSRANASLKRITVYLDSEEDVKDAPDAVELSDVRGDITLSHFTFRYKTKEKLMLQDVSLSIKAGEKIGVVGKIGCGKSTLVNCLVRLYNVGEGQIFIDGTDIMKATLASVRRNIVAVPQDNFLFSDTLENNIAFGSPDAGHEKVVEAACFSDVDRDISGFKDGYGTVIGERGVTLSGGQKQRIAMARAYLCDAPVLILDDSVSAVDVRTEETILHNILEKRQGRTTIIIASRVSTVSRFDRIIVLDDGKLEAFDTPENLLKTSRTYQKMVYLQQLEKEVEGGK